MPRKRKNGSNAEGPTKDHNAGEIKAKIRDVCGVVKDLEAQKADISAEISEAKASLKEYGIKPRDFTAAYKLHKLDTGPRNEALDSIRLCFDALGIGEQGTLFPKEAAEAPESAQEPEFDPPGGDDPADAKLVLPDPPKPTLDATGSEKSEPLAPEDAAPLA